MRKPSIRRVLAGITLVATVATGFVATTGGAAQAVPVRGAGYVWAHSPQSPFYVPSNTYQYNSTAPFTGPINTVTKLGVGRYRVTYPNLGADGGTVHVTAYGGGTEQCKVEFWTPNGGGGQDVTVRCFSLSGQPVDTLFSTTFTNDTQVHAGRALAYLWANDPFTPSYFPDLLYQFNSSGAFNRVTRTGAGTYAVELPNLGSFGGHVQVTAYGLGTERCKVAGWGPNGTDLRATIRCFTLRGALADTQFTLTFADRINILNVIPFDGSSGHPTVYSWTHDPFSVSYPPAVDYTFDVQGPGPIATRSGVGTYAMHIGGEAGSGNVQITAYGWGPEFCKVVFWNESSGVNVRCFNNSGAPVDTQYDMAFTGPIQIG